MRQEAMQLAKDMLTEAQTLVESGVHNVDGRTVFDVALILALANLTIALDKNLDHVSYAISLVG